MTTPMPWSYSSLSDHANCPRAFYEKRVIKSVKDEGSEALVWGNQVHKAFELYVGSGTPLPDVLKAHTGYLNGLRRRGGVRHVEKRVALNRKLQPCGFFDKDVWWRGVLDYHSLQGCVAELVDYKTGKRKPDWRQMQIFGIWIFAAYPEVETISMEFYWTALVSEGFTPAEDYTAVTDSMLTRRKDIPKLWSDLTPDLKRYAQSFKDDVWPEKPSGLCSWCPVKHCQHWKPRRR